jgi:hypothetical protein
MKKDTREYLASIGSKGGKARGKVKARGDRAYYQKLAQKAAESRKGKAKK